jgi:hypothetical protein
VSVVCKGPWQQSSFLSVWVLNAVVSCPERRENIGGCASLFRGLPDESKESANKLGEAAGG